MKRKDPYAKERALAKLNKKNSTSTSAVEQFFGTIMQQAKGADGYTPVVGKDFFTPEQIEQFKQEVVSLIPKPKDADEVDYDLVLSYVIQETEKEVAKQVAKLPKPKDGKPGKDAVVDIPAIVESLLKVMPKMEAGEVDYLGIKEYIDKQVSKIAVPKNPPSYVGGGAGSIRQLTDVVLDGLTQDSKGNYILGGGGTVSDETYGSGWDGVTDEAPSKNAVYDKIQALSLGAGTGDVVGPVSAVDERIAVFDGITGKLIKDGGVAVSGLATAAQGALADSAQQPPAEGAFVDGDKTKLDGIETGAEANVVDSVNAQTGAVVLDADDIDDTSTTNKFVTASDVTKLSNLSGTNTGDQDLSTYQVKPAEGAFVDGDKTKLDGIEAGADVTDTANVTAAGALMDSEVTNLAQVKAFDSSDYAPALGVDDNYVTDAEKVVIGNTSGTNTGDEASASTTVEGVIEIATDAEFTTGTDTARAVTADQVASVTQTMTNKTLTDAKIVGAINAQTGTSYTLVLTDASKTVTMSNASANTLTVPPNASVAFPTGTRLMVQQLGVGATTIAAGAGVTINAPTTVTLAIDEQYESRGLLKTDTNTWQLI